MKFAISHAEDVQKQITTISKGVEPYFEPLNHGTMSLGMYAPRDEDLQEPHDQDELYFVLSGCGVFVHGDNKSEFKTGDALFVAAGVEHRFEDFTDDFYAWVVFWGKKGGEV